jgi:hypothetical protein
MPPPFGPAPAHGARRSDRTLARGSGPTPSSSGTTTSAARRSAAAALGAVAVLEVERAGHRSHGLVEGAARSRAARRADAALARASVRRADVIVTPNAAILPPGFPDRDPGARMGRRHRSVPVRTPAERRTCARRRDRWRSSPGRSARGTARSTWSRRSRSCARAAARRRRRADRRRLGAAARAEARAGIDTIVFTGALPARSDARGLARRRHRRAPFDVGAHAPLSLGFYWSPLKIFEYMASGLPVVAPRVDRIPSLVADGRKGFCTTPRGPEASASASADALLKSRTQRCARALGAAARERAVREYSWAAHCRRSKTRSERAQRRGEDPDPDRRLSAGLRRQRLEHVRAGARLRDARARRHDRPAAPGNAAGVRENGYDGFRVLQLRRARADIPYVRNYYKSES